MKLHDDLADLKSYFDGQKDRFDEKKLFSIGPVQCPQIFYIRALPDLNSNSVNRKLETSKYIPHNWTPVLHQQSQEGSVPPQSCAEDRDWANSWAEGGCWAVSMGRVCWKGFYSQEGSQTYVFVTHHDPS